MHELGVCFIVLDQIEEIAKANNVRHVKTVCLEVGEVSTVIPKYLNDVWDWAVKKRGKLFEDCALKIEVIQAITFCTNCKCYYETVKYAKVCPYCNSDKTYLDHGDEFNIKEIEVDEYENTESDDKE